MELKKKTLGIAQQLKFMKGHEWGLNPYIQKVLYKTVIEKIVTYGAAVWSLPMQGRKIKHLLSIQRPFLLNITKAFRTSPTKALCVLTGLPPLHLSVEKEATYQTVAQLGQPATLHEDNYFPAEYEKKLIRLCDHPAKQGKGVNINLKQNTNITDADLVYYTDGSQIDDNTGCAYIALRNLDTLTLWKGHLDTNNSVFQSEVLAIDRALTHIIQEQHNGSFILTDSLSSLHALLNPVHCSPLIADIQSKLHDNSHLNVKLQWIKAHAGQTGNELADQLAKEAAQNINAEQIKIPWPISWLKKNLTQKIKSLWQEEWNSDDTGRRVYYHIPTVTYDRLIIHAQLVRYITGHGPFPVYFERFGITNTAQCICGELGTPEHYVANCPLTTDLHLPIPPTNEQAFSRFMINNKHAVRKINKIVNKLMDLGTDLCQI
ncbi:uncharacterized protein LOC118187844 [Stegodyphus dumicola]|nr:uncharacterized protein LOC118187844 [Stegodyphus dumicola]